MQQYYTQPPSASKHIYQSGFTLVEMSIFLVIISLLVGAIVIGQAMIHQSEMRKTISQVTQFRTSINAFVTQYDALPGDFKNAEEFWGDINTIGGTENGDGDKLIEFINNDGTYEGYRAWQHLGKALLTPGPFSGSLTGTAPIPGIDLPKAEPSGAFALEHDALGMRGHLVILIGQPLASTNTMLMDGNLRPEDAFDIDTKMDDGTPTKGTVRGSDGEHAAQGDCIDAGENPPVYDLKKYQRSCFIGFQF